MSGRLHHYRVAVEWAGRTTGYRDYSRDHRISGAGRPDILASSDPSFRGDPARWNPEQLFVASIAACHKLWFLHLAAEAGVVVTDYRDEAEGVMDEVEARMIAVTLRPKVTICAGDAGLLPDLHKAAHARCFIARSVSMPVHVEPSQGVAAGSPETYTAARKAEVDVLA